MKSNLRLKLLSGLLVLEIIAVTASLHAQLEAGAYRLFDEGNVLYQQEEYSTALEKFHQIEEQGLVSPALYFNLGNTYYKLGQIGRAVLYYERALRLAPRDDDVLANLAIANQATVDKITPPPEFALATWLRSALYLLPISALGRIIAVLYLSLGGFVVLLIVKRRSRLNSALKRASLVALTLLLITATLFLAQWQDSRNRVAAIVLAEQLPAMDAPGNGATEVFSIHEGTKVSIEQSSDGWAEIVLPDGKIGWVSLEGVEII